MARRFDPYYRVKRNDNLGEPDFWNRRWDDVDRRLHERELDSGRVLEAVDQLEAVGLQRLNETFTPIIEDAINKLAEVGAFFEGHSDTTLTVGLGAKTLTLDALSRPGWVRTDHVEITSVDDPADIMIASVESYERTTGELTVVVLAIAGAGTHDSWEIRVAARPDTDHATRTDNPHNVTAAQLGVHTAIVVDALLEAISTTLATKAPTNNPNLTGLVNVPTAPAIDASTRAANTAWVKQAIADLVGSAPDTLNVISELATAISNDPNFASTMAAALANRIRFDAVQTLTGPQFVQVYANLALLTNVLAYTYAQTLTDPYRDQALANLRVYDKLTRYDMAQVLSAAQRLQVQRNLGFGDPTSGLLYYVDANTLNFGIKSGDDVRIAGKWFKIPTAGIAFARTGVIVNGVGGQTLTDNTIYLVCLIEIGGVPTPSYYSTAAGHSHVMDTSVGNEGTQVLTSGGTPDTGVSIVGLIYHMTTFVDSLVLSYRNRKRRKRLLALGNPSTASATPVVLSSEYSCLSWKGDVVEVLISGQANVSTGIGQITAHRSGSAGNPVSSAGGTYIYGAVNNPFLLYGFAESQPVDGFQIFGLSGWANTGTLTVSNSSLELIFNG